MRKTGKGFRTRSQTIIDGKLLIDLPADTYMHFLQNGIKGDEIESLLITHTHEDHFYPKEFDMRGGGFSKNMKNEVINLLVPSDASNELESLKPNAKNLLNVTICEPYKTVVLNDYKITPLPARHGYGDIVPFIYLINKDGKNFLYAHDTGYFLDEVIDYLVKNKVYLSGVSYDCCYCAIPIKDSGGHMGYDNIFRLNEKLESLGILDTKTIKIVNHFSHNCNPTQELVEDAVCNKGYLVACDGLEIEI